MNLCTHSIGRPRVQATCAVVAGALLLPACSGKNEEARPPAAQPQAPYGQPQSYGQTGYPGGGYSGQAPGGQPPPPPQQQQIQQPGQTGQLGAVFADPAALQSIVAGALAGGAAALGSLTGGEQAPIEQGIKMQADSQAKGMSPDGQLMSARLQPDGHAEGSLTLQPGSCYTVIGFAGIGVLDYQINMMTAPPVPPQVVAQSPSGGVAPVVGGGGQCMRSPYPLPVVVKIDMHVLKGQGLVGAQVFKR